MARLEAGAGVGEAKSGAIIAKRSKQAIFFTDISLFP
jgi:DNA uptake protein ComE-like DNA-binding protein